MNLLIFLDLSYNPCKNFKFYSLQNVQMFLILPIIRAKSRFYLLPGGHMHTSSPLEVASPPPLGYNVNPLKVLGRLVSNIMDGVALISNLTPASAQGKKPFTAGLVEQWNIGFPIPYKSYWKRFL